MATILQKIVAQKREEIDAARQFRPVSELQSRIGDLPAPRDFFQALQTPRATPFHRTSVALIAEVKQASPSKGIIRADFDPVQIGQIYEANGADCLSVLTDQHFFQGHLDFLGAIRAVVNLPLLRKDFILDEYQVFEARAAGADAVLLIAECLTPERLRQLHELICELEMTPLIELYDEQNLDSVLACHPQLVGVNNRDLNSFEVDFQRSLRIKQQLPPEILAVSESGISTPADVQVLQSAGIGAMLVGESLMRSPDIGLAVRKLLKTA